MCAPPQLELWLVLDCVIDLPRPVHVLAHWVHPGVEIHHFSHVGLNVSIMWDWFSVHFSWSCVFTPFQSGVVIIFGLWD